MRCPKCRRDSRREEVVYYRYRSPDMNEPAAMASLGCGCQVSADTLRDDPTDWESVARQRRDDTFRAIFE